MTADVPLVTQAASPDTGSVQIIDVPSARVRRFSDLISLSVTLVGIAVVLLIAAYASGTTNGISEDVRGIYGLVRTILVAPVNVLEGIVTLVLPVVLVLALAVRRDPRRIVESLGALVFGVIAALATAEAVRRWGSSDLVDSMSITARGESDVTLPAYLAGLAAMLTTAGRRRSHRAVSISWNIAWVAVAIAVISGLVTLAAALVTVLVGRAVGLFTRYALGSSSDRAYGEQLIEAIRRAGFEPARLVRVQRDGSSPVPVDPVSRALGRTRQGRVYQMDTVEGHPLVVIALDGDQQFAGTVSKVWRMFRLRGLTARADMSLRHSAEGTVLVSYAARAAGVRSPRPMGMAQARETMVLVYQRPTHCRPFSALAESEVTDEVLDSVWSQVSAAHRAGIAHRSLHSMTVLVCDDDAVGQSAVWLTSWELGEVASGVLSRRMDTVQVIAMTAAKVGAERAVAAALRAVPEAEIAAVAPLLQAIILPRATRAEVRSRGKVLAEVRNEILERMPETPVAPERITRFGLRTVFTLVLGMVAVWLVLSTFNAQAVLDSVKNASPWWIAVIFAWTLATFVGAALAMIAFSPIKLPPLRVLWAQVAAAYVALVAPAGVGPAAINLRLLTRRNVHRPLAVATVALVQVSAIIVTVLGLFTLSLVTGSGGALAAMPSSSVLVGIGVVAFVLVLAMTFPGIRAWVLRQIMPTIRQTWPRLVQILGQPWRLGLGLLGNLVMTVAYVGAFHAALSAFGQELAIIDIAVLFLLGNAVGALVPTPGGLGTVEFALITGLTTAGVPVAIATSVVVLFRAVTFWARIPMGYVAMRYLEKKGEL